MHARDECAAEVKWPSLAGYIVPENVYGLVPVQVFLLAWHPPVNTASIISSVVAV